jgi:hypothetical protein
MKVLGIVSNYARKYNETINGELMLDFKMI